MPYLNNASLYIIMRAILYIIMREDGTVNHGG